MSKRRLWLTSIRHRLALLFVAITAGAILVIYFYVVPQLESNLTSQKIDDLKRNADTYSGLFQNAIGREVTAGELDALTRQLEEQTGDRVTLLGIPTDDLDPEGATGSPPYVISDSTAGEQRLRPASNNVLAAARTGTTRTATESEGGKRLAQAAKPILYRGQPSWVVVFSEPLDDVADNVALIERQVLIAGLIALIIAVVSGYSASRALSRRVKRLEEAAGEVAAGNFSKPITVDSEDELGQLARAFNEMQRKLARLDEARKEFIANASHELRTPIFSLGGFVELLSDEDVDERTRDEFLATMREQIDRLQKLTTDLLDLSRLDAGSLELELEPVPLRTLARQIADEFAAAAARRGSHVRVAGGDSDSPVEAQCDIEHVAQILRVLLDNALTHGGDGTHVVITARTRKGAGAERAAELAVADNGSGIPRNDVPHVFERFYTGNSAQGSGLGLAIARELAEHMSGTLEVTSRPGRTTFRLFLPVAHGPVAQDGDSPRAASRSAA